MKDFHNEIKSESISFDLVLIFFWEYTTLLNYYVNSQTGNKHWNNSGYNCSNLYVNFRGIKNY